jgi:hypothetical protein
MWFKKKQYRCVKTVPNFQFYTADSMPKWGHFDPLNGYKYISYEGDLDPVFQFIGFYLGDGGYGSANMISFHLRKTRELTYLRDLLQKLRYSYREAQSATYEDAVVFYVKTPDELHEFTTL